MKQAAFEAQGASVTRHQSSPVIWPKPDLGSPAGDEVRFQSRLRSRNLSGND